MAEKFKRLRATGEVGGWAASILTFLTTNWQLTMSILAAIVWGSFASLRAIAFNPVTAVAVGAFLVILWTIIGITVLADRRRPRQVQAHLDYRYGLTFEGFIPNYQAPNAGVPNAGDLKFGIQMRNFSPGPVKYVVEDVDIRLGNNRGIEKFVHGSITGKMARGAARLSSPGGFPKETLKEFYGKGLIKGTVDFAYSYGPPDGDPVRRLRMSLELFISLSDDGSTLGYGDNILSENDDAI